MSRTQQLGGLNIGLNGANYIASSGEMLHSGSFISDSRHYTVGDTVAIYGTGSSFYIDMSLS